jgi:chromosome segregation protein
MTEMPQLLSVRLRGFKTFAKPTELVFEPGVTVIIGPNGSGKSNIADAVLWVLGEQSPGNLRGRSMQDVIFSGPDGRRSSAVAEVSLVFDNQHGGLAIEAGEVEVTRRLERQSGSEYRVNGSSCRLLDVQDLVGGLGIGREMHSVISQGKVEALLNSTPEVRRAMVEEAAGLGRFKKRRERAQAKLERTRQNLVRMADIEREVKSALRPLRQQAAAAGRFTEAKEEWALARGRLLLAHLLALGEASAQTKAELARLEEERTGLETGLAGLRRERAAEEDRFAVALQERERVGAVYHRLAVEAEQILGKATSLRQRVARVEADLDRARRRREIAWTDVQSLGRRLAEVTERTADESRLQRVTAWGQSLRSQLETAVAEFRKAAEAEDEAKDAAFEMETARARALQDREFLRREIEARQRIDAELQALTQDIGARVTVLAAEAADHASALQSAEEAVRAAEARVRSVNETRDAARVESAEAARREASLTEALSGIDTRRAVLEDLVARRDGTPAGARELMARSEGSRLLAETIEVEAGYERAVAAALGPLAQAVVLGVSDDLRLALEGDEALEAIVLNGDREADFSGSEVPTGAKDLWEVLGGPSALVSTLRRLLPPTAVLIEDVHLGPREVEASQGSFRLVNRRGEILQGGMYAARRREMGVETLLRARNELQAVADERVAVVQAGEEARVAAAEAAAGLERAEALLREAQQGLSQTERDLAARRNDSDLGALRLEEALRQSEELHARQERESGLAEGMVADLAQAEEKIAGHETRLETARGEVRAHQARLDRLRQTVAALEQKKAQAGLVEVRLRERCRAQEGERERVSGQREAALAAVELWERRTGALDRYLPLLAELLTSLERLAEHGRVVKSAYEARLEDARAAAEGAARLMRDTAGSETGLQQQYDAMAGRLTELQVERARQEDRRTVMEEELADLRRKHLSPRSLSAASVAGENLELLAATEERAGRRLERMGPINPLAEQECAELEERAAFLAEQRRDLEASLAQLQEVVTDLDRHIESSFTEIFEAVKENFASVIATVFPGAKGTLKLVEPPAAVAAGTDLSGDSAAEADTAGPDGAGASPDGGGLADALAEETRPQVRGIGLEVKFANKSPRSLSLLSGGEKAMAAIAFLFSLFLARPCPFYILDEVEASLDDINIRRFLSLVRRYRDKTQFIIITHQRQTMEVADTLYGVTLESDGTSRILSRRLKVAKGA